MSSHRFCCCGGFTPGTCADIMCIEGHPSTLVVSGISGVKRLARTLLNVDPCANDYCNPVDNEGDWIRLGGFHHQVNFAMLPTVLKRVGGNCCYVADDVGVSITWTYSQTAQRKKCIGDCPLIDWSYSSSGAITVPGCYRVECISGPGIRTPYLVHRLSWCTTPAPDAIPLYQYISTLNCNDPAHTQPYGYAGLYISGQSICWRSPVQDLTTLGAGDYYDNDWCGCGDGNDVLCDSATQTVYACIGEYCGDGHAYANDFPKPFETSAYYDPENPPAPCSYCGNGSSVEPCGGVVIMCGGGTYENNDTCYDCEHTLLVSTPEYA